MVRKIMAALIFGLLVGCAAEAPPPEPLRPVRSEQVFSGGGSRVRTFSGTARAGVETNLSFRVPGRIERFDVKVGDRVRAGQIIARLDPKDFELSVERARAALDQARASGRNADANLQRIRGLWENGNASQNDLDASLAAAQSSRAEVESAGKALEQSQRQRDYTVLRAPVNGAIASTAAEVSENVASGEAIVMLTSGSRLEVEVAMPEQLIAQVQQGDVVGVSFDALPGPTFEAIVTEVGVVATSAATAFPVTVRLSSPSEQIRPGMASQVTFRFDSADDRKRFYVRAEAVGEDRAGRFVFVLETGEGQEVATIRRTPVTIGDLTPDGIEIFSGLEEGQRVVTAGVRRLTDGQRVKLLESEFR